MSEPTPRCSGCGDSFTTADPKWRLPTGWLKVCTLYNDERGGQVFSDHRLLCARCSKVPWRKPDGITDAEQYLIGNMERTLAAQRTALLALSERIRREGMQGVANSIEEIVKL